MKGRERDFLASYRTRDCSSYCMSEYKARTRRRARLKQGAARKLREATLLGRVARVISTSSGFHRRIL